MVRVSEVGPENCTAKRFFAPCLRLMQHFKHLICMLCRSMGGKKHHKRLAKHGLQSKLKKPHRVFLQCFGFAEPSHFICWLRKGEAEHARCPGK